MKKFNILKNKIELWLTLLAENIMDLSKSDIALLNLLDKDPDIFRYLSDCESDNSNLNIEEWSKNKAKSDKRKIVDNSGKS